MTALVAMCALSAGVVALVAVDLHRRDYGPLWGRHMAPEPSPEQRTEALHQLLDDMDRLLDTVDGYRAHLAERGYNETAAEVMAVEFHRQLVAAAFGGRRP